MATDWPRWAQPFGIGLGVWQILEWKIGGSEPNLGIMTFAGSLLLFQRAASARHRRENGKGGDS